MFISHSSNKYVTKIKTIEYAASNGHYNCLKYAYENGCPIHLNTSICAKIAENGHLECLKYIHTHIDCPWDEDTCTHACFAVNLDCLKYAYENGCKIDIQKCLMHAKFNKSHEIIGSMEIIDYLNNLK